MNKKQKPNRFKDLGYTTGQAVLSSLFVPKARRYEVRGARPLTGEVRWRTGFQSYNLEQDSAEGTWTVTGPISFRINKEAFGEFLRELKIYANAAQKIRSGGVPLRRGAIAAYTLARKEFERKYAEALKALVHHELGPAGSMFNPRYFPRTAGAKQFWKFVDLWGEATYLDHADIPGAGVGPRHDTAARQRAAETEYKRICKSNPYTSHAWK